MSSEKYLLCITGVIFGVALSGAASSQVFPSKPIRIIVGYAPGGGADINARLIASKIPDYLGQPVIVENKPGAGSNISNDMVAKAAPDGYTLLVNTAAVAINMSLYKDVTFNTLRDFTGVSMFSTSPNVLAVHVSVPARTVKEFVALAQTQPGKLNYSSAGSGTTQHLSGELLKHITKTNIVHIPYKGSAPSMAALAAGEVQVTMGNIPVIQPLVKADKARVLAVTTSRRSELMPDVPTMKEAGYDMDVSVWYGLLAPSKTPAAVIRLLADAVQRASKEPDIKKRLNDMGSEPLGNSPEEFAKVLRAEVATWSEIVKASGATAE